MNRTDSRIAPVLAGGLDRGQRCIAGGREALLVVLEFGLLALGGSVLLGSENLAAATHRSDLRLRALDLLGKELANHWGLADLSQWNGPKISTLRKEDVLKEVVASKGDVKRGEQVFALLGCAKCHDIKPTEALRGPYLPNVAKTYKRDQLTEAILMPSKSIAQGFVQNVFRLDDDRVVSGFVTKESPEKIVLRNAQGDVVEIEVESIAERKESPVSVMPEGLADGMPVSALADLVSYLESLN